MRNMTLEKIAQALGGRLYGAEGSDLSDRGVQGVVIDNRQVEKDYLFIPIRGSPAGFIESDFGRWFIPPG